jgi:hypothetical protein
MRRYRQLEQRNLSIYGVANPFPVPQVIAPTGDVTLTAGTEVLIATTTAIIAPAGQDAYPWCYGCLILTLGAAAPSALVLAMRFNGGADILTQTVAVGLLVNLAVLAIPVFFVGANSGANFAGAGKVIEITGKATTQAATATKVGTQLVVGIGQGPDA